MPSDAMRGEPPRTGNDKPGVVRALVLLSGGLDSQLAVCVLRAAGVETHGVSFESPFFSAARARQAAAALGIPLEVLDFTADIVEFVKQPPHGFGANMNPCIDCHGRMLKRAGALLPTLGAHLLATGEVLNERPMSQNPGALRLVARLSGHDGWVLRPLSARLLPETEPERRGWIRRDALLALHGRSRNPQLALAKTFGLRDFPSPAGGCRLTEPHFSTRLRDLKAHEGLDDVRAIRLLRFGRHFRFDARTRLVVGRSEADNADIEALAGETDCVIRPEDVPGPTALLPAHATEDQRRLALAIVARYSDLPPGATGRFRLRTGGQERTEQAAALPAPEVEQLRIRD